MMEETCTRCGAPLASDSSRIQMTLYVHGKRERCGDYCPNCATQSLRRWRETEFPIPLRTGVQP